MTIYEPSDILFRIDKSKFVNKFYLKKNILYFCSL